MPILLESVIDNILTKHKNDSSRLDALADYAIECLATAGLPGTRGGSGGELCIHGFARSKNWDVAYEHAGKNRLLISLKSLWKNASGTVPNRIDELLGEAANVQQMSPEVVTGYILLFDTNADSRRQEDGLLWSVTFEQRVKKMAIRKAPLWNQGLIEGCWFILLDSSKPLGARVVDPPKAVAEGAAFFSSLISELRLREPAIPFSAQT
jgi:hypothetical protein